MKGFVLGVIVTLVLLFAGVYEGARRGYIYLGADGKPSFTESRLAMSVLDAAVDRNIPGLINPVPDTEENIAEGAKIYLAHCAGCHGVPANADSTFGESFYPPVPGFFKEPPDMSEVQNFYIVKHGIRWTGMPSFGRTLSDQQTWQAATFLSHITTLSPATRKIFDSPAPASPPSR